MLRGIRFFIVMTILIILFNVTVLPQTNHAAGSNPGGTLFSEIERIELKLDDIVFAKLVKLRPLPDGYVLILDQSQSNIQRLLVKIDKKGNYVCKFDKRGNGPGEIREIESMFVTEDSILVSEMTSPFIHKYSHNLEFLKDYRIKRWGIIYDIGKYVGIWAPYYKDNKTYTLALYDKDTLEFKRHVFEIDEVPMLTHYWGDICKTGGQSFAAIYPKDYQISQYDHEFNRKGIIIDKIPAHIRKYTSPKMDPQKVDHNTIKWFKSWTKMRALYFVDGKYILQYLDKDQMYLDIISVQGELIRAQYKMPERSDYSFSNGKFIWRLLLENEDEEETKYTLIKEKLNL
jgi:hypothetical protein